jgi:hydrogenase-4 component E
MGYVFNPLLVLILLLNFLMLGSSRHNGLIRAAAWQGMLLGLIPALGLQHTAPDILLVCLLTISIKGILIPRLLGRAMREVHIRREVEPLLGFVASMLLGAVGVGLAVIFSSKLPLAGGQDHPRLLVASFSTIITGFILITGRVKAITQVVGYLVLENGVFIFGLLLLEAAPSLVEMGILLDLLVSIFIMGIIINHIHRTFSSIDTRHLAALKE